MPALVLAPLSLFVLAFCFVAPIVFKLYRKCKIAEITPEWLANFSAASYYPMQGLLAREDFAFLSRQPGFDFSLQRKLRRERLRIFRQYLNRLILDFNRLHGTARFLLAHSDEDQSHLVARLIWLKLRFSAAVVQVEASYLLCCLGFGSLAVHTVISRLEEMSGQLSLISSAQLS